MIKTKLKKQTENIRSLHDNIRTYNYFYRLFYDLAISSFVYENIPDEINTRYFEKKLFEDAAVVFGYDEVLKEYICLPCTQEEIDLYGEPKKLRAIGANGYNKLFTNHKDGVVIYNNNLRSNSVDTILFFASKLTEIERTIDTNIYVQKTPFLIRTNEKQLLTINQVIEQYENNNTVIKLDSSMSEDFLKVLNTDAKLIAPELYEMKVKFYNEALTYLGISNVSYQKRERLISDEVIRQQGGIIANRNTRLQPRQKAIDEINKLFNLNIEVKFNDANIEDAEKVETEDSENE